MTSRRMPWQIVSWSTSAACWVETTTVSTRFTAPSGPYSTVTWALPSGRSQSKVPFLRTSARRRVRRWAKAMGAGIYSGVSSQAKPNIMPWSPAPVSLSSALPSFASSEWSTPRAMSPLCSSMLVSTAQVLPSKPYSGLL